MKRIIKEETILFVSILKWFTLATAIGALTGLISAYFVVALDKCIFWISNIPGYYLLLPIVFLSTYLINHYLFPSAKEHTTNDVVFAIHKQKSISLLVIPKIFITSILTIAFGGSAGKEAPCADMGAGLGSFLGRVLKLSAKDVKKLVICGVSAGFASAFGVPLSGAIFGLEVLSVGALLYEVLFPAVVSGITSFYVSSLIGLSYFREPLIIPSIPKESIILKVVGAGIIFGIVSLITIEFMKYAKRLFAVLKFSPLSKAFFGGLALAVITFFINERYLGLGMESTISYLKGVSAHSFDFLGKISFTAVTLNFGGSGGIITPLFYIGASAGNALGQLFSSDNIRLFSALGMVSLISGCCNTPLSASIMAIELFGPNIAPYAIISCIVSFIFTGHRTIYPAQILSFRKSESINVHYNETTQETYSEVIIRENSLTYYLLLVFDRFIGIFKK